jgi:hypothetical protein
VLDFLLTEDNFQIFGQIASYRQSSRLEVLPGFPQNPAIGGSIHALEEDVGTREQLARANLTARDYMLTGWAMIIAHDPEEWGLSGDRITANMRHNIEFVQSHRVGVEAFLR